MRDDYGYARVSTVAGTIQSACPTGAGPRKRRNGSKRKRHKSIAAGCADTPSRKIDNGRLKLLVEMGTGAGKTRMTAAHPFTQSTRKREMTPNMYITAFDAIARNVREFICLLIERIDNRRARESADRDERWSGLIEAARDLESLVVHHRELIKHATASVIEAGDLATTAQLVRQLVYNDSLPDGYSRLKGAIKQYSEMHGFSQAAKDLMRNLLGRTRSFQLAAFMIPPGEDDPDAWKGPPPSVLNMNAMESAVTITTLLNNPDKSKRSDGGLSGFVLDRLGGIYQGADNPIANVSFEDPNEVTAIVKLYCESWLQNVRSQLNYGRGVHSLVAALQAEAKN